MIDALSHVGAKKHTTPHTVTLTDGTRVTTIPDLWDIKKVGGMLEAKDVRKLSRTRQLDGQIALALEHKQPFNLVVSPGTQSVSGPLWYDVRRTGGTVYVYNPATDALTEFKFKGE